MPDPSSERPSPLTRLVASLHGAWRLGITILVAATLGGALAVLAPKLLSQPDHVITERPTPSLLHAIREVSRLETAEVHVEKVVDLTDRQSAFFGLVEAKDALLLVAVGRAVVGVDLGKMREEDVSFDPKTGAARIDLPEPEVLSATLDEDGTYVFSRSTDLLAKRNEQLEASARRQAQRAIEAAARTPDVMRRARTQAEKQLSALAKALGAKRVEVHFQSRDR
ncbi:DUF4230 domain-containing protein [Polyangium jinanense]|uniref:DUF4230 domain-containing protein n=1 Tax=Polyangium jinanense TaxID=2829994 RepID=A0A9X3XEG2_9BACT|nr:DUF4230 domain-containing protein [Polyangium jinanense]MDC3956996.1 DUF4230 domain-containing protein [Polyangium jinanense]MDC3987153.1 DUF4230 domain-containing protein [Polyangium jinanense]